MGNKQYSYENEYEDVKQISPELMQKKSDLTQIDTVQATNYFVKRIVRNLYLMYEDFTINSIIRILDQSRKDEGYYYYIKVNISLPNNTNQDIYFSEILQLSEVPPSIINPTLDRGEETLYLKK